MHVEDCMNSQMIFSQMFCWADSHKSPKFSLYVKSIIIKKYLWMPGNLLKFKWLLHCSHGLFLSTVSHLLEFTKKKKKLFSDIKYVNHTIV